MKELRLYDSGRRPPDWTDIVGPGQYVAFSKHAGSGASCDAVGKVFASASLATCLVFDTLDQARLFCEARVQESPHLRFDVFDSAGRTNPPLLEIVNTGISHILTASPRAMRLRTLLAVALLVGAVPLLWLDYRQRGVLILPTVLALNMILLAWRLFHMNMTIKEVERRREERLRPEARTPKPEA